MLSWGFPTRVGIQAGYNTYAVLIAHVRAALNAHICANWVHNAFLLGGPQHKDVIKYGYKTRTSLEGHMWAKWLHNTLFLGMSMETSRRTLQDGGMLGMAANKPPQEVQKSS